MLVFVIDQNHQPRNPIHPGLARQLLKLKAAAVYRMYPFTLVLKCDIKTLPLKPVRVKIDPGAKTTGLALLQNNVIIWKAELTHRGFAIHESLSARRAIRRNRRHRKTRYRKPRFLNRTRCQKWIAPSLMSRVYNILTWVKRLAHVCNITAISLELVRFDTQKMRNPEISGVEYQQGSLMGYELREYLLEKWKRECAYCGTKDTRLEIEHIQPRCKGGSNSVTNLTIACHKCNQKKGEKDIKVFLKNKPDVLKRILANAKKPLAETAAVNGTRWELYRRLQSTGLSVEVGTGGLTKFNRCQQGLPKTHWLDAACVGKTTPALLKNLQGLPLLILAMGWGCRQMMPMDKFGFPRKGYKAKQKVVGWNTGDIVSVIGGKYEGVKCQRIKTTRAKGNFDIRVDRKTS
ncbi:MAG TPA: HNH endonuclease, partial [Cyanobacteria bacterium UBA11149]|nr:HNH endonuclease [Cyanobacteria bacterium UBA11367]HBE59326.1 HNH endonuclease [Cyanobacteria bacterium UBA11366]HBR75283.1 HNH endonuclease [Cyanobacteria bacterium UBA11159]HBS69945.1 HNH endonuclease [Cyanobacteria bacterium UBA11153]HBW90968.1 HNH endonuclease [Cyanobacteria bacterium UBA11149]HCA94680.1 HNH endonuclease [Cyanobacteria bacterium UBA9226]